MTQCVDLAIIGGGCAGLSLARDLVKQANGAGKVPRTIIIEPRAVYENDRTWCFWTQQPEPLSTPLSIPSSTIDKTLNIASWKRWNFSTSADSSLHEPGNDWLYSCIPADNFYQDALTTIQSSEAIELRLGQKLHSIQQGVDSFLVRTTKDTFGGTAGDAFIAKNIIDTRPPEQAYDSALLLQAFAGVEIESDAILFEPDRVGLMQDMASDRFGFKFNYLLPLSPTRVLIESTRFCRDQAAIAQLPSDLDWAIARYIGNSNYQVVRRERGVIPMGFKPGPSEVAPGYVRVGTAGGAVRAATGYAFQRIQTWSQRCATKILQHEDPVAHPRDPFVIAMMDKLFLRVLRQHPQLGPELFMSLATNIDPASLVRFMSDQARPLDLLNIVLALPKQPFLHQLYPDSLRSLTLQAGSINRG